MLQGTSRDIPNRSDAVQRILKRPPHPLYTRTPPSPTLREQHPCQHNGRCCFRNFWNHVLLCPLQIPPSPRIRATAGAVSVKFGILVLLSQEGGGGLRCATW